MVTDEVNELLQEAQEHLKNGRYKLALIAARGAYRQKQEDYNVICCFAWALLENGNPVQALEMANYAVQISNDEVEARLYRGFFLMRMGIFEGALSDLDWVITKQPEMLSWAYLNKARSLAGLGRFFEGLEEIEKAIKADKEENKLLIQIRDWFKRILGYEDKIFNGIFSKKRTLLEDAVEAVKAKEYWFSL